MFKLRSKNKHQKNHLNDGRRSESNGQAENAEKFELHSHDIYHHSVLRKISPKEKDDADVHRFRNKRDVERCFGVVHSIEGTRQKRRETLGKKTNHENSQTLICEHCVFPVKFPGAQKNSHDLRPKNQNKNADGNDEKNNLAKSVRKIFHKFFFFILRDKRRQRRKNRDGKRRADYSDRHGLQILGKIENCQTSRREQGSKNRDNQKIDLIDGNAQSSRNHQMKNFSDVNVFERFPNIQTSLEAKFFRRRILNEHVKQSAKNHAPSQANRSEKS